MSWVRIPFEEIYFEPSRNGIYKSKEFHGKGAKIVNMGELFGYEFIGPQEMKRVLLSNEEQQKACLEEGDLLFGRRSLIESGAGKCSIIQNLTEPTTFESSLIRVRLKTDQCCPKFYYYWFRSPVGRGLIRSIVTGTNVKGIRGSDLRKVLVVRPEKLIQEKIASILSAYDDLIENNRHRIELLEESARLLYQEWFVRLRFPGHETTKIINGVPEGWKIGFLTDSIEINPKESVDRDKKIIYVPMASLSEKGMAANPSNFELRTKPTNVKFRKNDVLLARITPCLENGKTGFAYFLREDEVGCGSTEFIVMRGKRVSPFFTYCLARSYDFRELAIKSMTGSSGRQRVQPDCFKEFPLPLPPENILKQFDFFTEKSFSQVQVLLKQNQKHAEARDLLLPRLMSGEIEV